MRGIFKNINIVLSVIGIFMITVFFSADCVFSMEISFCVGNVALTRSGKNISPEPHTRLLSGDIITTGKGGIATLSYEDGSEIKMLEKTRLKIGSASVRNSDSVSVVSGSISAKFKKLMKADEKRVYTPTTVCAVRGTDFLVGVSDAADSRIDLNEGKLNLRNPYGNTDLNPSQKAESGLNESPARMEEEASIEDWKNRKDSDFNENPEESSNKYSGYFQLMGERNSSSRDNIADAGKKLGKGAPKDRSQLEKTGAELGKLERKVEEDMYLSEAASSSIDGILTRFGKDKEDIYNSFLKVKEESNKVMEQQRVNYEAILAVKEAYKKAYEEIMGKHKDSIDKIKGGINKESTKPEIKK